MPLHGGRQALRGFADRARRYGRGCSSIVGRAELVLPLWDELSSRWSPPREVRADQPLLVLEAMKMEHTITAPHPGVIAEIVTEGAQVTDGMVLVRFEEAD